NALNGVGDVTPSLAADEFAGHQLNVPGAARHADSIVADSSDGARAVGAVEIIVTRIPAARDGVDAIHIVHVPVAVVVDAIGRFVVPIGVQAGLAWIAPHVGR